MSPYTIKLVFLHPFSNITSKKEITINIAENANFKDLLAMMTKRFGNEFQKTLMDDKHQIRDSVFVLVNGKNITALSDNVLSVPLAENQEYVFCASIGGGQTNNKR
jgi:hypothetical protein